MDSRQDGHLDSHTAPELCQETDTDLAIYATWRLPSLINRTVAVDNRYH